MEIWEICQEITSKKHWYSKVFNPDIIYKWSQEVDSETDTFTLAIKLLQSSAKGCSILNNCEWEENKMCPECIDSFKQRILSDPVIYGLVPADITENFFDDGWEYEFDQNNICDHPTCKCTSPHHDLHDYINYHPDGLLDKDLHLECKAIISAIATNEPIDWHPGSDEKVRDIIHPSLYCYVKGISVRNDKTTAPECLEDVRYQWLPSRFDIATIGKVKVMSYINNLSHDKYPGFIPLIERVFEKFIPSLENVLHRQIYGQSLQVIVKVGSINLTDEKSEYSGGSWHIEGMPYEYIAATCIHYVDIDNITDSFLEFRKPTIINEENIDYPQSDSKYTTHHYGIAPHSHHEGVMNRYLGLIKCSEGSSIVFPNTLQHRVNEFNIGSDKNTSLRTILAFFVIDPDHAITSTEDIAPQQGFFTQQEAEYHRERLMYHRKFFVDQLNEEVFCREFSLCEH